MIKGKSIGIFGFGLEGLSAANYLGNTNRIFIFDKKEENQIDREYFKGLKAKAEFFFADKKPQISLNYIIRSPGIRPDDSKILFYIKNGAVLTSATKIFFDLCPCEIIGVTGTKGKGTTSTLISEILKTENKSVFLGGNIGLPPLDFLAKLKLESKVVLELSSFQLIDLHKSPHIAVILMITSEHLDWHRYADEYKKAKEAIVANQAGADFAVINKDYKNSRTFAARTKAKVYFVSTKDKANGAYLKGEKIIFANNEICMRSDILLPGPHNLENVLAAVTVAKISNVKTQNIKNVLKTFKGLIHRLQLISVVKGVRFYDDSFSTTPETTIAAINSFPELKTLILGGSSKNSDFSILARKIVSDKTMKNLILIGQEAKTIKNAVKKAGGFDGKIMEGAKNMKEIVEMAFQNSEPGDIVLLSPACASFDLFTNYKDRGEQFKAEVLKLAKTNAGQKPK